MATYQLVKLSGGNDGRNIKVIAISTPGTLIHTANATHLEEICLEACNTDTIDRKLTIEWGGTTAPDDLMEITIPAESGWLPITRLLLTNGLAVRAFAATANVININGFVNRAV